MRRLLLLALVGACGGGSTPPPAPPAPEPPRPTRVPVEDDEPEDGVTMVSARGRMDPEVITQGIAPHTAAMGDCYVSNVGRRRWLGGKVLLHWDIQADATVTGVRIAESDLGNWQIEKCLLDVARLATFGPPKGGDADFQLPVEFAAKGRSLPWEEDQAIRAVGGQLAKLDACAKGDVVKPDEAILTVYVGPGGRAQSVGFSGSAYIADAWADCAEKVAMAWRLTDPRGTIAKLAIRYPMQ